nr:MAG TPA: hypothetical protein [Caudoviricetes sp.]
MEIHQGVSFCTQSVRIPVAGWHRNLLSVRSE